jgi:hypothetical protein
MSDILENNSVINFITLNGVNMYGIYDPNTTTLLQVLEAFNNNYQCKEINNNEINIISNELRQSVYDLNQNTLMKDFNLSKITKFKLMHDKNRKVYGYNNIINNPNIKPSDPKPRLIQVFCKSLLGKSIIIDIMSNATIEDLKIEIEKKERMPIDAIRLLFSGVELQNFIYLYEYGIQEESIIYIIIRLRGGMFHETSGKNGIYGNLLPNYFLINK